MSKKLQRKAFRSGTQACQICSEVTLLVEHHLEGRDINGANNSSNIALVCSNCHDRIHASLLVVEGWLMTTSGRKLLWHAVEEDAWTGRVCEAHVWGGH